jgi:hypothetical protein
MDGRKREERQRAGKKVLKANKTIVHIYSSQQAKNVGNASK